MKLPYLKANGKYILKEYDKREPRKPATTSSDQNLFEVSKREAIVKPEYKNSGNNANEYENISFYTEGIARAKAKGKWFFIDNNENIIQTKRTYTELKDFHKGLAMVKGEDGFWYLINKNGTEVNKRPYEELHLTIPYYPTGIEFYDGFDSAMNHHLIDINGNEIKLTNANCHSNISYKESDGIIIISCGNNFYRGIDHYGMEIFKTTEFSFIGPFYKDRAIAMKNNDKEMFIINKKLNQKKINAEVKYESSTSGIFYEGFLLVKKSEKYGYLNIDGELVCEFESLTYMENGFAIVGKVINGKYKYSFINSNLKEVIPYIYDEIRQFSEGVAAVRIGNKWGFIDEFGKEIIVPQFTHVNNCKNGFMVVSVGDFTERYFGGSFEQLYYGRYGYYNCRGEKVSPIIYDRAYDYSSTSAIIKMNNYYGIIDLNGIETTKIQYDYIDNYFEGFYNACFDGTYIVIDSSGYQFSEKQYDKEVEETGHYFIPF